MRWIVTGILALLIGAAPECKAQQFEIGGLAGFGVEKGLTAKIPSASADIGLKSGAALGVVLTDNMYSRLSGEVRYVFQLGGFRVASGGQEATLSGRSHLFQYDILIHTNRRGSKVRPFVAAGGGVRLYQGTGTPPRVQPLRQFVRLANETEAKPVISFGGGVKWNLKKQVSFRIELNDSITQPPKKVLVPATGATVGGWLHDIAPYVGISYTF
jgi:hypothetical protein